MIEGPVTLQLVVIVFCASSVVAGIILWAFGKFQTKMEAMMIEKSLRGHLLQLEVEVKANRIDMGKIANDVSYIRGRLTPRRAKGGSDEEDLNSDT